MSEPFLKQNWKVYEKESYASETALSTAEREKD